MTIRDLIGQSLAEINAAQAGQAVQGAVAAQALGYLNMILDLINASDQKLYADLFSVFNITPNHNPHTIGPVGADWTYPIARPNRVPAASVILTSTPNPRPYIPLVPLTTQQWQNLTVPTLASNLANYFYYNPTSPLGEFYFWTVESTAYQVQIQTRQMLAQVDLNTTFAQPPGYWGALMMLLARKLSSPLRKPWSQQQQQELLEYCYAVFGQNSPNLTLATRDLGVPSAGSVATGIQDFSYADGQLT